MKKIFIITLLVFVSNFVFSQGFGNKLKEKVLNTLENKTEQKVEEKTSKTYDKADQKVEDAVKGGDDKSSTKSTEPKGNSNNNSQEPKSEEDVYNMLNQMLGGSSISFEEQDLSDVQPSKFIGSFKMNFETSKGGKPVKDESGEMEFFVDKFQVAIITTVTDEGETRMILDRKTAQMTMLTTDKKGKKTGIKMKMLKVVLQDDGLGNDDSDAKITITNEKKTIEGLSCTKVIVEDDEHYTVAWVTDEKNISLYEIFNYLSISSRENKSSKQDKYSNINGLALEAATQNKNSGETTLVKVTNLKKGSVDSKAFETSGYELMDMSQMMNFGK
jgi:hypothetical protein